MGFLASLFLLICCGLLVGALLRKLHLPPLLGMLACGMLLGPYVGNVLSADLIAVSADLRELALFLILLRAGLSLDLQKLRSQGRIAVLLCFVPALFEIAAYVGFSYLFYRMPPQSALILGCVMAAVSPAVIVPRMLRLQSLGYGTEHSVPQVITAGASADDILVIVLFSALTAHSGGGMDWNFLWQLPVGILSGIGMGILIGFVLLLLIRKNILHSGAVTAFILVACAVGCSYLQDVIAPWFPYYSLLSPLAAGVMLYHKRGEFAQSATHTLSYAWAIAEPVLFGLIGAAFDPRLAAQFGFKVIGLIFCALAIRLIGVWVCTFRTPWTLRERIFLSVSYVPKATVQAAIGAIPLSLGLPYGDLILTCAVLAIFITAPLGAFAIDLSYPHLLRPTPPINTES